MVVAPTFDRAFATWCLADHEDVEVLAGPLQHLPELGRAPTVRPECATAKLSVASDAEASSSP